ncbi:sensor histidine kinase (plasmid) [Latilactobacillus sp. 5-91]|uniref:sensor histidine kinase n=1 Tax=Latilactobacillus sp. 5-91 TaxID=3410924 RepID=UPI003C7590C3
MAKRKTVSLNRYIVRILLEAFAGISGIIVIAIIILLLLFQAKLITPANTGEIEAHTEITNMKQKNAFPSTLHADYYDYVYFDKHGKINSTSLNKKKLKRAITKYSDKNDRYINGTYIFFPNGSYCLVIWQYKIQFTNRVFRQWIPNPGLLFLMLTVLTLFIFLTLFIQLVTKKLQKNILLVESASQQIREQSLEVPIVPSAGISELNDALQSMEDMRVALENSLYQQWQARQKHKQEIAALTHDIKTPLTVINGNAELLLEDQLDDEHRVLVIAIHNAGLKAKRYVDVLQQVSNFEILGEKREIIDVTALLKDVIVGLEPLANVKEVLMNYDYSQSYTVEASPLLLARALTAIVENAIQYTTRAGNIKISVSQTATITSFVFEDTGSGFSIEALKHAKEMFWQQDNSRSLDNYGIGLALTEKIAQQHRGYLNLENTDSGAKVTLTIETQ